VTKLYLILDLIDLPDEVWKDVVGYEGRYQVSNMGRVKRLPRVVKQARGERLLEERIQKQTPLKSGHLHANLRRNSETHTVLIHRLVLEAFVGPCPCGFECCHEDDDSVNNILTNLYWGTRKDNIGDRRRNGILVVGERATGAKLTAGIVREIRNRLDSGELQAVIVREYGLSTAHVSNIYNRKVWVHV
jgi:hypothetical protein